MQHHRDSVRIVVRPVLHGHSEILSLNQSSVAVLLEIKEPGCALDVGQHLRLLLLEEFKPFTAGNTELEVPNQLRMMKLADPQEVEHRFIEIIENFDTGRLFVKKDLSAATERLDISGVFSENKKCSRDIVPL
jgi:hypothetical protein